MPADRSFVRSFTVGAAALHLEDILRRPAWQRRAACRDASPDWFHGTTVTAEAAQLCAGCPVREPCLLSALQRNEHGTWGGTDEHERVALRRQWRKAQAAAGAPPERHTVALPGLNARRSR